MSLKNWLQLIDLHIKINQASKNSEFKMTHFRTKFSRSLLKNILKIKQVHRCMNGVQMGYRLRL